jgi:hypothetical protein
MNKSGVSGKTFLAKNQNILILLTWVNAKKWKLYQFKFHAGQVEA